jgi:hypothetical protein
VERGEKVWGYGGVFGVALGELIPSPQAAGIYVVWCDTAGEREKTLALAAGRVAYALQQRVC